MDYRKKLGQAKDKLKDFGAGGESVIDDLESEEGIDPLGLESGSGEMDEEDEYVRGDDMVADMERDIEISRNRRRDDDDDELGLDFDDLDDY